MGLDMYAMKTKDVPDSPVDFDVDGEDLFYWRKHPNLHGWMEALYRSRGGMDEYFNLSNLALTLEDLDLLEQDVENNKLPHTDGFFFGSSQPEDKELTKQFIKKAREAIAEGYCVYYRAWW